MSETNHHDLSNSNIIHNVKRIQIQHLLDSIFFQNAKSLNQSFK